MRKRASAAGRWPRPTLPAILSAAAVGTLVCSWWLASPPVGLSINEACQPKGVRASVHAWLDGAEFWSSQLWAIRHDRKELDEAPAREARRAAEEQAKMAPTLAEANRLIAEMSATGEKIYREYADLGPSPYSPAAKRASELRAMADAIEWEETMAYARERAERNRLERIAALTRCEKLITERHSS